MRVLHWTDNYWPVWGGLEILTGRVIGALRPRGWEATVVADQAPLPPPSTGRLPPREVHDGVTILRFPSIDALRSRDPARLIALQRGLDRALADFDPHLVHIQGAGPTSLFCLRSASLRRCPRLLTLHHCLDSASVGSDSLQAKLLAAATWVTAVSGQVLESAVAVVPDIATRSSVVYNALETPAMDDAPPPADPRIICVGRLVRYKGYHVAIDAFARISARHPRARLLIVGDGDERAALEQRIRDAGLGGRASLHGWSPMEQVWPLIAASTFLVQPALPHDRWREGFGLSVLQAAQAGRPAVASRLGGLIEVVQDGVTGLLVPPDDATALAGAMDRLLSDPDRAARMGQAARLAAGRFSWSGMVDQYDTLYRRVANAGPGA
ncbi:MAG: D-inositol-3-phosphate glycosyltransferase [Phycisphaerae bacterium]|nr:D-inositol-3-phosphate glycosyltransferase [Phycisphaerae bacterium]